MRKENKIIKRLINKLKDWIYEPSYQEELDYCQRRLNRKCLEYTKLLKEYNKLKGDKNV